MKDKAQHYITCEVCGKQVLDDEEHNAYHNMQPRPCDSDSGMCSECVDWSSHMIFDKHIEVVTENLSPENRQKFVTMPFNKQCWIVLRLTEKGVLTWVIGG